MSEHRVKPGKMNEEAIERARGDLASIFGSHDFRAIANGLLDTVDALDAEIAAARTMREESEGTFGRIAAALGLSRQATQAEIEAAVLRARGSK